jgi:hypothetical protein
MNNHFRYVFYLLIAIEFSFSWADSGVDFFRAVQVDDAGTVRALLARGFDPNALDEHGQNGLFVALRDASPKVATTLLAHPAIRVDAANASDETPLMMAALRGEVEWAERLLARGARVNRPGWGPLHYAACSSEPAVVALLLARGADIEAASANRTTPLMMAARYGTEGTVDLLLERGASPRARNDKGLDAAAFARLAGRDRLASRLESAAR